MKTAFYFARQADFFDFANRNDWISIVESHSSIDSEKNRLRRYVITSRNIVVIIICTRSFLFMDAISIHSGIVNFWSARRHKLYTPKKVNFG